jgi:hypothetical protein
VLAIGMQIVSGPFIETGRFIQNCPSVLKRITDLIGEMPGVENRGLAGLI